MTIKALLAVPAAAANRDFLQSTVAQLKPLRATANGFSRGLCYTVQHAVENVMMKWHDSVPVEDSEQPPWQEAGNLLKLCLAVILRYYKERKNSLPG